MPEIAIQATTGGAHRGPDIGRLGRSAIVAAAALAVVLPLLWVVRIATKPPESYVGDPSGLGGGFTLHNFSSAWSSGSLGRGFLNSLSIAPLGAVIATALAALAGYGLARLRPPGGRLLLGYIVMTIAVPIPAIVIPLFAQGLTFSYADSRIGLSLVYGTLFCAWGTYFMFSAFQAAPDALFDAARIDGATELQVFARVALPLAQPALIAVLVINLFIQWSELLLALVMLPDPSKQTIMIGIATFTTEFRLGGPLTAAGMIIAALPIFIIYVISQRYLRPGAFSGAVKA